jgi:hypothetical protein
MIFFNEINSEAQRQIYLIFGKAINFDTFPPEFCHASRYVILYTNVLSVKFKIAMKCYSNQIVTTLEFV